MSVLFQSLAPRRPVGGAAFVACKDTTFFADGKQLGGIFFMEYCLAVTFFFRTFAHIYDQKEHNG